VPDVPVTLACIDFFDRTRPLLDGDVETPGIDLRCIALPPHELDERFVDFDVAEVSIGTLLALRGHGDEHLVGIPVFPHRGFFLCNVLVNVASGIARPEDLAGKRVGTGGLHLAGTLWTRGFLEDTYGVDTGQLRWCTRSSPPGSVREQLVRWVRTPDTHLEVLPPDCSPSDLLDAGEIDAWIGPSPPECFARGSPRVTRLLPSYRTIEEDYLRRTSIFPIIHLLVIRRELCERHPWLAPHLVRVFERAREIGISRLHNHGVFACGLPWLRDDLEWLGQTFGGDWYRHGFQPNQQVLSRAMTYAAQQGFTPRPLDAGDLFAPETVGEAQAEGRID
jgi:4,5-dihydroxyphthalate decarboxylase